MIQQLKAALASAENGALSQDELAKLAVAALPDLICAAEALLKAEAVLDQIQDLPDQARDIVRQGYYGHALCNARSVLPKLFSDRTKTA